MAAANNTTSDTTSSAKNNAILIKIIAVVIKRFLFKTFLVNPLPIEATELTMRFGNCFHDSYR